LQDPLAHRASLRSWGCVRDLCYLVYICTPDRVHDVLHDDGSA
jgi:hypothetical protein